MDRPLSGPRLSNAMHFGHVLEGANCISTRLLFCLVREARALNIVNVVVMVLVVVSVVVVTSAVVAFASHVTLPDLPLTTS